MAEQLADMDARAYAAVLEAFRPPAEARLPAEAGQPGEAGQRREPQPREARRREALLGAALVPLEIAGIGARVAQLAVRVAEGGQPEPARRRRDRGAAGGGFGPQRGQPGGHQRAARRA